MSQQLSQQQLAELAQEHEPILRRAINGPGFRHHIPPGGPEAIDAGLVAESDPTWQYSDAYGACNGYRLTDLGQKVAQAMGWTCQCHGCSESSRLRGVLPSPTLNQYCSNCNGSIKQYGAKQYLGKPSCGLHAKSTTQLAQQLDTR